MHPRHVKWDKADPSVTVPSVECQFSWQQRPDDIGRYAPVNEQQIRPAMISDRTPGRPYGWRNPVERRGIGYWKNGRHIQIGEILSA